MAATGEGIHGVQTIIAFRHGYFELNERARLTGEAGRLAGEAGIPKDAHQTMDLLPEGREQAELLRQKLAPFAIDACLHSPTLRTRTTAEIALAGRHLPRGFEESPGLMERNRGIFFYAPDEWARGHPLYNEGKESTLTWRPAGPGGETLTEVVARLESPLRRADEIAPGGTVAFSMHAEAMAALRAKLLGFTDERFAKPLVINPPNLISLQRAGYVTNGQVDIYTRCTPYDDGSDIVLSPQLSYFMSIGTNFNTGWMKICQ